jgi:hypothetical protein
MNLALNILLGVFFALCLGSVASVVLSPLLRSSPSKDMEELKQKVQAFLSAGTGENIGSRFVGLIEAGFVLSLVMGNDSPGFDDLRQLEDFHKLNTPTVVSAIKKLGEIYDQYYI